MVKMQNIKNSDVTVLIPTLNEERNINKLMDTIDKLYPGISLIVSDDGSRDKTQAIIREYHKKNLKFSLLDRSGQRVKGLTASIVDAAKRVRTEYFVVIDGDFQHPPDKIGDFISKFQEGYEIVVGTRTKDLTKWSLHRRIMSKAAIMLGRLRLLANGIFCHDVVSGFFGTRAGLFKKVLSKNEKDFELTGYKVLFDFLKYVPGRPRLAEVYYYFGLRDAGKSKINSHHIYAYFRSLFK